MKYTGSSSNMAYYRGDDGLWVSVIRNGIQRVDGEWVKLNPPTFSVSVYRDGEGEVERFLYEPKTAPKGYELSPRTVARLIKERA